MPEIDRSVLLDEFPDAVIAIDSRDQISYVNHAVEGILGWSSSELLGRPLTVVMPAMQSQRRLGMQALAESEVARRPHRTSALHKAGMEVDVEVTLGAYHLDGEEHSIASLRLLEESVETTLDWQHQLAAQQRVMEVLSQARTIREGAFGVLTAAGKALSWDIAAIWLVDPASDVLRTAATWQSQGVTAKGLADRMATVTLGRGEGLPGEAWKSREMAVSIKGTGSSSGHSGGIDGPRAICFPIFASGEVIGVLEFFSREPSAYSGESLATMKVIARRIGKFIDRLHTDETRARMYHEAQEGVRARDELLSVAAHELKTPLCGLALRLQTMTLQARRSSAQLLPAEEVITRLDAANRLVQRLMLLMDELMQVSRFTNDRTQLESEDVNLSILVREVADRFRDQLPSCECSLNLTIAPGVTGKWDALQLDQMITNLLSNAMKYGRGKPIEIRLESDENGATLRIKDFGIGIAPEHQARIFERFERAVSGQHYGGLGLGLWIVRQIVEALDGKIRVHSEPGQGSEFLVSIPRSREQGSAN
jgi:PAS domain S-box-containing protein